MARSIRTGTSRGAHIRALHAALLQLEELLPAKCPSHKRVALRDHRTALERAYPGYFRHDVAVEQALAEEEGDDVPTLV